MSKSIEELIGSNTQVKKEISLEELKERLTRYNAPTNNYQNLINFATTLQQALKTRFNTQIGLYVAGGFVRSDFSIEDYHRDIDLILATNDRELLVPYRKLPPDGVLGSYRDQPERQCPLSHHVLAVLNSDEFNVEGMKPEKCKYEWCPVEALGISGDFFKFNPYGRPNVDINFNKKNLKERVPPIHLAVIYFNPQVYDDSDQRTFSDQIKIEREKNLSFCLLIEPNG